MIARHIYYTTYGTWLHGDHRGSNDFWGLVPPDPQLEQSRRKLLTHPPMIFTDRMREVVTASIREVCEYRGWRLHAVNVRTNHVHTAVSSAKSPSDVMRDFKASGSRALVKANLIEKGAKVWTARGGDLRVFTEESLKRLVNYIQHCQ